MPENRWQEKTILLMVIAAMLVCVVFFLRFAVRAGESDAADIFKIFVVVMLALVAVCVYVFVRQ